jgi:hypothetical protein
MVINRITLGYGFTMSQTIQNNYTISNRRGLSGRSRSSWCFVLVVLLGLLLSIPQCAASKNSSFTAENINLATQTDYVLDRRRALTNIMFINVSTLLATDGQAGDQFGSSVSLFETVALVGTSKGEGNKNKYIYIY